MIHVMVAPRLQQNKPRSDILFSFQLDRDARGLLYIVLFNDLNYIGNLLANIIDMDKLNRCEDDATTLRRNWIVPQWNSE